MNLIFIVGATATGKTDWALKWAAQEKKAGILNADSIQIYKELNKGSAKPDFSKYPDISFYLFNELQAPEFCTAGLFRKKALKILDEKIPKEKIFVVGGSGFYIQALEKGMYPMSPDSEQQNMSSLSSDNPDSSAQTFHSSLSDKLDSSSNKFRSSLSDSPDSSAKKNQSSLSDKSLAFESGNFPHDLNLKKKQQELSEEELSKSLNQLYEELKSKDPETAKNISPKDKYRIERALNIMKSQNKTLTQIKKEFQKQSLKWPYEKIGLFLSKEELLKRVITRTEQMLQDEWIEEVESLLNKSLTNWRALNSIGYKEIQFYLKGKIKKEDLAPSIITATMKLAKKQRTWFKKDKSIQWFDANQDALEVYKKLFQA